MRRVLRIALGITTSVGGFLDAGAIATAAEAGSRFRYGLIWAVALGTVCSILLLEMSGRVAIVSGHALRDAIHERFGVAVSLPALAAGVLLDVLILGSEIGGASVALQLVSGISFRCWAIPIGLAAWLLLWLGTFDFIDKAISFAGLVTLAFVIFALRLHPRVPDLASGLIPSMHQGTNYWYTAVAIVGAILNPYMLVFYSSGAIEDRLDENSLGLNRIAAPAGLTFGRLITLDVLASAALALGGREVRTYADAARMMGPVILGAGLPLFAACLGVASFGAAVEVSLGAAYAVAQVFGWNWSATARPSHEARFCLTYTAVAIVGTALVVVGLNPFKLTVFTMAVTCLMLPTITFPFLALANDEHYMKCHRNGRTVNVFLASGWRSRSCWRSYRFRCRSPGADGAPHTGCARQSARGSRPGQNRQGRRDRSGAPGERTSENPSHRDGARHHASPPQPGAGTRTGPQAAPLPDPVAAGAGCGDRYRHRPRCPRHSAPGGRGETPALAGEKAICMSTESNVELWLGRMLLDSQGVRIGRIEEVEARGDEITPILTGQRAAV